MEIAWKSVRSIVWKMKKLQKSELFSKRFPNRIEHPGGELAIHDFYQKIVFRGRKETFNPIIFTKNVPRSPHLGINISLKFLGEMRSTFPYYHIFLGVGRISNREKRVLGMLGQGVRKKNHRKILIFEKFTSH